MQLATEFMAWYLNKSLSKIDYPDKTDLVEAKKKLLSLPKTEQDQIWIVADKELELRQSEEV